jgi:hypothetical protein
VFELLHDLTFVGFLCLGPMIAEIPVDFVEEADTQFTPNRILDSLHFGHFQLDHLLVFLQADAVFITQSFN